MSPRMMAKAMAKREVMSGTKPPVNEESVADDRNEEVSQVDQGGCQSIQWVPSQKSENHPLAILL